LINETVGIEIDSFVLISESFKLNDILCHWEHVISYDGVNMKLKDSKTNKTLLEHNPMTNYYDKVGIDFNDIAFNLKDYFEYFDFFEDLNFDGFKDFYITDYGSRPMTDLTNVYIFNNETKQFEYSEELSDNTIEEVDSINKILTTSGSHLGGESYYTLTSNYYFDESGKIKFTERITEGFESIGTQTEFQTETYKKIINDEVVEEITYFTYTSDGYRRSEYEYFKKDFFPFDFKNYSTQKMIQYFYQGVTVDSIISLGNADLDILPHKIYTYRLEDSYISFLVKDDSEPFYLTDAEIKKDLFKSKNGVGIGISSKNFFLKIKSSQKDCKHFTIGEGDLETLYHFDLKDGVLRSISIQ